MTALEKASRAPDLLLSDVVMPGARGDELARRLCATLPDLHVLLMSGYTDLATITGSKPATLGFPLLQKPFEPAELTARVRQAIEAPPGVSLQH